MPLFDHDDAQPSALRAEAALAERAAERYTALSHDIVRGGDGALLEVGSTLQPGIVARARQEKRAAVSLARASSILAGVLKMFADDVDTYNREIDQLNAEWDLSVGRDFGIATSLCLPGESAAERSAKYDLAVTFARSATLQQLQARQRRHEQTLYEASLSAADMLKRGPDDEGTAIQLIATGYLSRGTAVLIYPAAVVSLGKSLHDAVKFVPDSWQAPGQVKSIRAMVLAARRTEDLEEVLKATRTGWAMSIRAFESTRGLASLSEWMAERRAEATAAIAAAEAAADAGDLASAAARADMLEKVGLASKLGKGLALLGIPSGGYEVVDTIKNWDDYDTLHRTTHLAEGAAGIASGTAAIVVMAGATGPAAPLVLVGAGLVAGGLAIYNNWDAVSGFVGDNSKKAARAIRDFDAFTAKKTLEATQAVHDGAKAIGRGLSSTADKAFDRVKDLTPW